MWASHAVVGVILLLFGRRLFWLFVGVAGFLAGLTLTRDYFSAQSEWIVLLVAVGVGLVGALLSVFLQQAAIAVAGFVIGGYVVASFVASAGYATAFPGAYLVGGIVGALLVLTLFDYALIVLSSIAGATLVAQWVALDQPAAAVVFLVALILGIVAQVVQLQTAPAA